MLYIPLRRDTKYCICNKKFILYNLLCQAFFLNFFISYFYSYRDLIYQAHIYYRVYKLVDLMNQIPKDWFDESNPYNKNMIYLV